MPRAVALRRSATPWFLLLPFLAAFLLLFLGPLVYAFRQSLFVNRMVGGVSFVGLANYGEVLTDALFWDGVRRIFVYGLIMVPLATAISLALALGLDSGRVRLARLFQTAYFLPYAIPGVVATVMWGFIYGRSLGPLQEVADVVGWTMPDLLGDFMLPSIGNISLWMFAGYNMVIFYTALQGLPPELNEAARLDGLGETKIALYIKVPLIMPAIVMVVLFSIIGTLQLFTEPAVLQPLAPGAITRSYTPNYYAYNLAATGNQFNYVSAVAFVLGAFVVLCSAIFFAATNRKRMRT